VHYPPDPVALRLVALAVAVLDDLDLEPYSEGVVLRDGPPLEITWGEVRRAVGDADPDSGLARKRLRRHLRGRRIAAGADADVLAANARPVGLPVDHPMHPGPGWVCETVLGGVLELGLGFVGVGGDPDEVVLIPPECLAAAEVDSSSWWPPARRYLERMGAIAAERVVRDPAGLLRPIGDCDALTLLGSRTLRMALAWLDRTGLRAVAVPMRRRGWVDLSRIDPAFAPAAAAATDDEERGFARPLLVTADEVTVVARGGEPARLVLQDPAPPEPALPDVRWRGFELS
jgi:hypothetical protein